MVCDNCGCNVPVETDDIDSLVGTKCPDCGEIMVTDEDVAKSKELDETISMLNNLLSTGKETVNGGSFSVRINTRTGEKK